MRGHGWRLLHSHALCRPALSAAMLRVRASAAAAQRGTGTTDGVGPNGFGRGGTSVAPAELAAGAIAGTAADLRHRTDRSGVPVRRLPLPADQPAPHRDLWNFGRGSFGPDGPRMRPGPRPCRRGHRRLARAT